MAVITYHFRNLKWNAGQEIHPRPTRPVDISQWEIIKSATCEQGDYWSLHRREIILHNRSTSVDQGRKLWRTENLGWCQQVQTYGISWVPQSTWPTSSYLLQKHRFLADSTGYYGNQYSITDYRVSLFFVRALWC